MILMTILLLGRLLVMKRLVLLLPLLLYDYQCDYYDYDYYCDYYDDGVCYSG